MHTPHMVSYSGTYPTTEWNTYNFYLIGYFCHREKQLFEKSSAKPNDVTSWKLTSKSVTSVKINQLKSQKVGSILGGETIMI